MRYSKRRIPLLIAIPILLVLPATFFGAEMAAPKAEDAFALVQRDGKQYNPFYLYNIIPHAVVEKGRVFTAHQDGEGRPIVNAYDIERQTWQGPVRASSFGLGSDNHGAPSILIDSRGHLHLFFGCHGGPMKHVRSVRPYDISRWREMPDPAERATYPETMRMADGRLFLFYRAGTHVQPWSLRISANDGFTWSRPRPIVELRRDPPDSLAAAYCTFLPGADGRTVHCFFVHKDDNAARVPERPHPWRPLRFPGLSEGVYRYNVYYIFLESDGIWRTADGTAFTQPISKAFADRHALVYDTGHEFARHNRFVIDENNRPYIRFHQGVVDWVTGEVVIPYRTLFAAPDEGHWRIWPDLPEEWPRDVRRNIVLHVPAAHGAENPSPWFIGHIVRPRGEGTASYVYLGHIEKGYARRAGGPVPAPGM